MMKFYLIGIKGSGMASLAHLLADDGYEVCGSDVDSYIFTQVRLLKRNIQINPLSDTSFLNGYFVIVGHDFIDEFLIKQFKEKQIPFMEYHKFLSFYLNKNKLVAISGSHGKTTLTGLLASASNKSSVLRGDGYGKKRKNEDFFFLESCEYKDHFLTYQPNFIFITNIDYDHVDYFLHEEDYINSFKKFAKKTHCGLIDYDSFYKINNPYFFTYGLDDRADFYAEDYTFDEKGIRGKIYFQTEKITEFAFDNLFGIPLIKDIVGVIAFYFLNHYDLEEVKRRLAKFKMADKRFNILKNEKYVVIDDYAHHPTQIDVNYQNVKTMFKDYISVAIFKPDRPSRIKKFILDFQKSLSKFDLVFVTDFNDKKNIELLKQLENEKIVYLSNLKLLPTYLHKNKKYVFSLMSSKNLNEVKEIVKYYFK